MRRRHLHCQLWQDYLESAQGSPLPPLVGSQGDVAEISGVFLILMDPIRTDCCAMVFLHSPSTRMLAGHDANTGSLCQKSEMGVINIYDRDPVVVGWALVHMYTRTCKKQHLHRNDSH